MSSKNSADQALIRELNLSLVLQQIHNDAPVSRAQIAQITGLNKSTVSSLVESLIDRNLIHETGIKTVGTGRPATLLEINPRAGGIIGVELGIDFVAVALTDFAGSILWKQRENANPTDAQDKTLAQTLELINKAVVVCKEQDLFLFGLGVATPGTVDLNEGILVFAPNLQWRNVPLKEIISSHTGIQAYIENDANAAAVAEHLFGAARQSQNFIFVFAGVGIGGGLFLNGELHRGNNGYAGELGHSPIMIEPFLSSCHCGNQGCWETYANQYSIIKRVQARLEVNRNSIIPGLLKEENIPLSISIIKQAADDGDPVAIEALSETGVAIGLGIANLINIFNPEKIIFGGPLSIVGEYLLPSIKDTALKHSLPEINPNVEILLSGFAKNASLIGAVSIVVDDILQSPTIIDRPVQQ